MHGPLPLVIIRRLRKQRTFFLLIFLIGTCIAGIGWFAELEKLQERITFFQYSSIIVIAGHALQVIGAFGSLLTPDYVEEEDT